MRAVPQYSSSASFLRTAGSTRTPSCAPSGRSCSSAKNYLFAGSDGVAESWAVTTSLIQTVELNSVEPFAYPRDMLERIISGHTKANALISPALHRSDAINRWLRSPFARTEARFVVARTGQRNDLGPRYHRNLTNVGSELSLAD